MPEKKIGDWETCLQTNACLRCRVRQQKNEKQRKKKKKVHLILKRKNEKINFCAEIRDFFLLRFS